jgi:hypothetical protein
MQVYKEKEEDIAAHNSIILDKRSKKVVTIDNQFIVAPSLNHGNEGCKNSEIHSIALTPSPNLYGNKNCSYLNLQNKLVNNCDDTLDSIIYT